jgi:TRAP-type C4-dicarboxylate transport system permease small subunit
MDNHSVTGIGRTIENTALVIGGIALLLLALLQVASVLARVLGGVVPASSELALGLVIVMVATALVAATAHGSHPQVRAILQKLNPRVRRAAMLATGLLAIAYWALLFWHGWILTRDNAAVGERTEILGLSVIPFRVVWLAGLAAMVILLALRLRKPPDAPAEPA